MYTIIAGTNLEGSNSLKVAKEYQRLLKEEGIDAVIFSLEEMNSLHRNDQFVELEKKFLIPSKKFMFILPEYNGAFPGIFKLMIDLSDVKACWPGKKVLITGLATGRAGNLRGIDMATNLAHHLRLQVLPNQIPLSSISAELENDKFSKNQTIEVIKQQLKEFIQF